MVISFSKAWGQEENKWNYCGGDWNFRTIHDFMEFYGIKEAWVTGKETYLDGEKEIECFEYSGWATKEIDRLKKHWIVEHCKLCTSIKFSINKIDFRPGELKKDNL